MTSMNESYFQDYSLSERPDENIRFLWTLPELAPGNMDVNLLIFLNLINCLFF